MAPKQCPNCGRFLSNALVEGLADGSAPCPGCEVQLTAGLFGDRAGPDGTDDLAAPSVRPPDLPPEQVRDDASDVLDGWDRGAGAAEIASWAQDRRPFPTDTVVVASGALGGALLGAVLTPRRGRGAVVGALLGLLVAAGLRRIWQLQE